jgi:hypothetical protein
VSAVPFTLVVSRVPVPFAEQVRSVAEGEDRSVSNFTKRALQRELERVQPEPAQS